MIIYNSVSDEIERKLQDKKIGLEFIEDLILLYGPNDKNKDGENLLTIFLNHCEDTNRISQVVLAQFFDKKFKLQVQKINSNKWNALIYHFIDTDTLSHLPKFLSEKDEWFYLKIPTFYTKELMNCFYKPKHVFYTEHDNILYHIFHKTILFENENEIISYLNDSREVIAKLFLSHHLNYEHLDILVDENLIRHLYYCIERPLEEFDDGRNIKHILECVFSGTVFVSQSHGFDSETYLIALKNEIFHQLLDTKLDTKLPQKGVVKKTLKI